MMSTTSIAERLRQRKFFEEKTGGRGKASYSKYLDLEETDTESSESKDHTMKGKKNLKRRRKPHEKMKGRGKNTFIEYVDLDSNEDESGSASEDDTTKQKDLQRRRGLGTNHGVTKNHASRSHKKMNNESGHSEGYEVNLGKCGESHHPHWIKRPDGTEVLCEREIYDLMMNDEPSSMKKHGKHIVTIEDSQGSDDDHIDKDSGGLSDSDTDVEVINENNASGFRKNFKSMSRNNNVKRIAYLEQHGEHGKDHENLWNKRILEETEVKFFIRPTKKVSKMKRILTDTSSERRACAHTSKEDVAEGMRNENARDDVNCHSVVGKNTKCGRRNHEEGKDEVKFFIRPTKKVSTMKRILIDASPDPSGNSSSSSYMDSEDEDFEEENCSSYVSEESGTSLDDEDEDEDEDDDEDKIEIKEKSNKLDDQKTSSSEHAIKEKQKNKKVQKGKKVNVFQGISERVKETEKQAKHTCTIVDEEAKCTRERGKLKKVEENLRSKKSKPIHYDEDSASEYKLSSLGTKRKKAPRKEDDGSCSGVHVDRIQEGTIACHDQASVENVCHETDILGNLKGKKVEQQAKQEKVNVPKQNKFVNILINSIIGQGEVFEEQAPDPEPEARTPSPEGFTLLRKFRFEDEEPEAVEKSEEEKMVEALFDELVAANVYASDYPEDDNKNGNVSDVNDEYAHPCSKGNHDLYIDEEIGLICRHCSYVEREIRYIDPEFATNARRETCTTRFGDREKLFTFNGLDFFPEEADVGEAFSAAVGTVWDTIPGIKSKMYEHQQDGFEFLWKNLEGTINVLELRNIDSSQIGGCIISHAPGTGKTLLTIVFLRTYLTLFPSARPMIIAPASMLLTWEEEFRKWQIDFPFHNVNNLEFSGKENKKLVQSVSAGGCIDKDIIRLVKIYSWSKQKSILGISYSLFQNLVGEEYRKKKGSKMAPKVLAGEQSENFKKILLELPRLVVMDEGHTPRNSKSCIWNILLKLQTKRKIILTGTPFQNNFGELFNTLRLVRPATAELFAKEKTFADMITRRRYYPQRENTRNGFSSSRVEPDDKAIEKLKAVIAPFVHVHKGTILQRNLPGLRDCAILVNPRPRQRHLMNLIEDPRRHSSFDYEHKIALISTHPSLFKHCTNDKQRAGIDMDELEKLRLSPEEGVKTKFVIELVRLSSDMREKVLVFSQYTRIHELLAEQLTAQFGWSEGRHVIQMHGKQEQKFRQNIITKFNDPQSEAVVLLASTKCCSEGINLVGASRVVLLDVVWNPSVERQAISRAYRLGQQKIVHTYHLMAAGTTEGDKYCRQVEKDRLSEMVFSSTTKESEKMKNPALDFDDIILEKMLGDVKNFEGVFEKVIYQPKEANLIGSFGLAPLNN